MKRILGLVLAGAIWLGLASAANAQFSLSIGGPYGGGVSVMSPYGIYGSGYYPFSYTGWGPGMSYYSSSYSGFYPRTSYYSGYYGAYPGYYGYGYGTPYYGYSSFYGPYYGTVYRRGGFGRFGGFR